MPDERRQCIACFRKVPDDVYYCESCLPKERALLNASIKRADIALRRHASRSMQQLELAS